MRIALAVLNPNTLSGGNKFSSDLSHILEKLGHKVALCCWEKPTEQAFDGLYTIEKVYASSWIANRVKGRLYRTVLTSGSSIKKCVNEFKPDLVITADLEPGVFRYVDDDIYKIHYCHFPTETKVSGKSYIHLIYRTPYWHQHYKQLSRLDYVVCNSHYTENIAKHFWEKYLINGSFKTIYPSVDINQFNIKKDKLNQICYVGRISKEKGIDYIIESFIELYNYNKCNLKIVGGLSGNNESMLYARDIAKKISDLKNASYPIDIRINVSYDEIVDTLVSSKAMISYNPEEHFGIVPIEAQAAGCIPIVADGGGQQETVKDKITGFRVKNPKEISKYAEQILTDNRLYQKMALQAKTWVNKFSIENASSEWNKLLLEIEKKRSSSSSYLLKHSSG